MTFLSSVYFDIPLAVLSDLIDSIFVLDLTSDLSACSVKFLRFFISGETEVSRLTLKFLNWLPSFLTFWNDDGLTLLMYD